jgi:hypothetical protein
MNSIKHKLLDPYGHSEQGLSAEIGSIEGIPGDEGKA